MSAVKNQLLEQFQSGLVLHIGCKIIKDNTRRMTMSRIIFYSEFYFTQRVKGKFVKYLVLWYLFKNAVLYRRSRLNWHK
jgi:hypothetical protein